MRHGLSAPAVRALWTALVAGGGRQAQFSHPELGGMGQWSGGMVQIGDMFNTALRAKVAGACADLAALAAAPGGAPHARTDGVPSRAPVRPVGDGPVRASVPVTGPAVPAAFAAGWWPGDLGSPSSTGAQNATRYAYFAARRRLVIERDGRVTIYDTGQHVIAGVSQAQGSDARLVFTSQAGTVEVDSLRIADES